MFLIPSLPRSICSSKTHGLRYPRPKVTIPGPAGPPPWIRSMGKSNISFNFGELAESGVRRDESARKWEGTKSQRLCHGTGWKALRFTITKKRVCKLCLKPITECLARGVV